MSEPGGVDERSLALLAEGFEAYNKGDISFALDRAADDIKVYAHGGLVNSGTFEGRAEFERWMREWQEAWSEITLDILGIEQIEDFIVVEIHQRAIGAASGVPVDMDIVQLFQVSEDEILQFHLYPDRETALAALREMGVEVEA